MDAIGHEDRRAQVACGTLPGGDTGLPLTCQGGPFPAPPPRRCLTCPRGLTWHWSPEKSPWCPGTSPRRGPSGSVARCCSAGVAPRFALPGKEIPAREARGQGQLGPAGSVGAQAAPCPARVSASLAWLGGASSEAVSDSTVRRSTSGKCPRCRAAGRREKPALELGREQDGGAEGTFLRPARKMLGVEE